MVTFDAWRLALTFSTLAVSAAAGRTNLRSSPNTDQQQPCELCGQGKIIGDPEKILSDPRYPDSCISMFDSLHKIIEDDRFTFSEEMCGDFQEIFEQDCQCVVPGTSVNQCIPHENIDYRCDPTKSDDQCCAGGCKYINMYERYLCTKRPADPVPPTLSPSFTPSPTVTPVPTAISTFIDDVAQPTGTRIVGGNDAEANEYAFFVLLMREAPGGRWQTGGCGGSLIDACWVITAAHCVYDRQGTLISDSLGVYVNAWMPYNGNDNNPKHISKVSSVYPHPGFIPGNIKLRHDIALLRLQQCADERFAPTQLAPPTIPINGDFIAIGLGQLNESGEGPITRVLQEVVVPFISRNLCNYYYQPVSREVFEDMVCAGYEDGGKDSCQGDSGGPLLKYVDNIPHLVGAVSWGIGCARSRRPGVYSSIQFHWDWIKELVCDDQKTAGIKLCKSSGLQNAPPPKTVSANCVDGRGVFKPWIILRLRCVDMASGMDGHDFCYNTDEDLGMTGFEYCPMSCNRACYAPCENNKGVFKPEPDKRFRCLDMIQNSPGHEYCRAYDSDLEMTAFEYCPESCNPDCY